MAASFIRIYVYRHGRIQMICNWIMRKTDMTEMYRSCVIGHLRESGAFSFSFSPPSASSSLFIHAKYAMKMLAQPDFHHLSWSSWNCTQIGISPTNNSPGLGKHILVLALSTLTIYITDMHAESPAIKLSQIYHNTSIISNRFWGSISAEEVLRR